MVQVPGGTPEPPRPRKITARFRGSPRPPPDLPKTTTDPAAPMTVESARRDGPGRAHGHGNSQHPGTAPRLPHAEACKQPGEPGTPQSPVPGSPGPPPALPDPRARKRATDDSYTAPTPADTETSTDPADTRRRADPARTETAHTRHCPVRRPTPDRTTTRQHEHAQMSRPPSHPGHAEGAPSRRKGAPKRSAASQLTSA